VECHVQGVGIAIDREQTTAVYDDSGNVIQGEKGTNAIEEFVSQSGIPVHPVAGIREIVEYLYKERVPIVIRGRRNPMDRETKAQFDEYMMAYGV